MKLSRSLTAGLAVCGTALVAAFLAACGGSNDGRAAAQPVRRVALMHAGTDHNPPSLRALVTRLGDLGWFNGSADQVMRRLVGDETKVQGRMKQLQGQFKGARI